MGNENLRIQRLVVIVAIVLFLIKVVAYYITHSVAILTDALEGTVNVVAGLIGLYSLYIAAKPRDENHPYGHGKAEFLSAAVEGTLIFIAGIVIIFESINGLIHPKALQKLDAGIILVAITAIINFIVGYIGISRGKKNNSLALIASGKHLQSDTYTTLGIIAGLVLIYLTGITWLDSVVAILFAIFIMYTGYRIVRSSIAGIMDEADLEVISSLVKLMNEKRVSNWVDFHNLRVIKYGGHLHLDGHLTVPWYFNVHEAHKEIDRFGEMVRAHFPSTVEMFIHSDGCLYFQCSICSKENCPVRKADFEKKIEWTIENVWSNEKHRKKPD